MQITFSLDSTSVTKKLGNLTRGVKDFRNAFNKVGEQMLHYYSVEVFEQQGVAQEAWRKLSAATDRARAERWGYYKNMPIATDKILVWTGRLKSGFRKEVEPMLLRIFNIVDYFPYHQKAQGRPPQRRMLALTSNVISQVRAAIVEQIRNS